MASGTLVDRYTGVDRYAVCDSRLPTMVQLAPAITDDQNLEVFRPV